MSRLERRDVFWTRFERHLRRGPLREGAFTSDLHDTRLAAMLGIALGVAFTVCFLTGWLSHLIQHPPTGFVWPSRPAWGYRVTQGIHVGAGIAAIPLLLAKLWVAYPRLWQWPPFRSAAHAIERLTLVPLVAGSLFLLLTGVVNITGWYPWPFGFIQAHYAAAWVTIGALVVHVGAKLPLVRQVLFGRSTAAEARPSASPDDLSRRGFLGGVATAAGVLTLVTIGQTVRPLRRFALLAPRDPAVGPQGLPVNRSAVQAGVEDVARDPAYRLLIDGAVRREVRLTRDELAAMPQHEAVLPIACVEGWSATAAWRGVRVRDLLDLAGAPPDAEVVAVSLEPRGSYRRSRLNPSHARDGDTLLALEVNGETLDIDHGYPARLIGPNRPGVMNTKWVTQFRVLGGENV